MTSYKGKTEDAQAPILGAEWWKEGKKIAGKVLGSFPTKNGTCYSILLAKGMVVGGETVSAVAVGALTGFQMAMRAAGLESLLPGDGIYLECTGHTPPKEAGHSPMVNFTIEVQRNDEPGF